MAEQVTMDAKFFESLIHSLDCYAEDLRYKFLGNDIDTVNFSTSGTPSFDKEENMNEYLANLYEEVRDAKEILNPRDKVIRELKEKIQQEKAPETLHKLCLELASLFEENDDGKK